MIARYEDASRPPVLDSPGQYALGQSHKHLPEMVKMTGLTHAPLFSPVVGDFYSGMVMTVQLHGSQLNKKMLPEDLAGLLKRRYECEPLISVQDHLPEDGFIYSNPMKGSNCMEMYAGGNQDRLLLMAVYDNLGKGASGAAIQNLNIVLGTEETMGLKENK